VPVLVFAAVALLLMFVLSRSTYGLTVYLLGANPLASRFAGIDNAWVTMRTYVMCGALSAAAGIVLASRANSAKADYGQSYLLLAVLIAVLGGTNPYGGVGRVGGVVLAVLALQFTSSGLNMLQVSNFAKEFVWGATLLAVMGLSQVAWRRRRRGSPKPRPAPGE
jgi:simple sugar transport system permease protein